MRKKQNIRSGKGSRFKLFVLSRGEGRKKSYYTQKVKARRPVTPESGSPGLQEEVQQEERESEEQQKGAEGEAATGELADGVEEADGDHPETGFAAAEIERSGSNVAGEIAAKDGKFVIEPECEFSTIAPEIKRADNENGIAETG
jgi:hypothetical protein